VLHAPDYSRFKANGTRLMAALLTSRSAVDFVQDRAATIDVEMKFYDRPAQADFVRTHRALLQ
jgi:hypothetical protein